MRDTLRRFGLGLGVALAMALALCVLSAPPADAQTPKEPPKAGPPAPEPSKPAVSPAPKTAEPPKPAPKAPPKVVAPPKPAVEPPPPEPPVPRIDYVFPPGGQVGTAVEVAVGGLYLEGARDVRLSGAGVTARVVKEVATRRLATGPEQGRGMVDTKVLIVSVQIPADAAPGERDLRVFTAGGVSNRFRFFVGQLPEAVEAEPNSDAAQAQRLPSLPVVVNGQIMPADKDLYRFSARAGQTLVCEAGARSILPYIADAVPGWLQATLTLYDAGGRDVAYADGFRSKQDPVIIYKVPKDGEYVLEIKDSLFRGREDFIYRLSVGALPFITDVYPLGAKRGTAAKVELRGVNLPEPSMSVALPADAPPVWPVSVTVGGVASNARPFAAGDLDESDESEPNDLPAQANRVQPPLTVNGRIQKPGDVDCFVFAAEAKQSLVIDVRARRLDSPLDSVVALLDAKGAVVASNDDTVDDGEQLLTHHADSRVIFTFPSAGDYVVRIGDVQAKGGEEYAYRLSIAPPRPDFALRISPDNPRIAAGDTVVMTATAVRKDGFDGEIQLSVKGLPAGYVVRGAVVRAKETEGRFTITAPADAPVGLQSPTVVGAAEIAGQTVLRQAVPAEQVMQAFSYTHRVPTAELLLAAVEPKFFTLVTDLPPDAVLEVPQGGDVQVPIKVVRGKEGAGAISLTANLPPRGFSTRAATVAGDKSEGLLTVNASTQAAVQSVQNIVISGILRVGKDSVTRYASVVPVKVVPWRPPGAADAEGLEALTSWTVDMSWSRPGRITTVTERGRGRVMEVACDVDEQKKLALVLLMPMDLSKAARVDLAVQNPSDAAIKVSIAFASSPDWQMHETAAVDVAPAKEPVRISFPLDTATLKSQASNWQHTQKMPNGGRIAKTMIIVEGLPKTATVRFDEIRFGGGDFDKK